MLFTGLYQCAKKQRKPYYHTIISMDILSKSYSISCIIHIFNSPQNLPLVSSSAYMAKRAVAK